MIITANSPEVLVLRQVWNSAEKRTEGLVNGLRRRLTRSILAPALRGHGGELILKYQQFLTRVPSGFHSFAHGSEMIPKTVYWVSVARMARGVIEEFSEIPPPIIFPFQLRVRFLFPYYGKIISSLGIGEEYIIPVLCSGK